MVSEKLTYIRSFKEIFKSVEIEILTMAGLKRFLYQRADHLIFWLLIEAFSSIKFSPDYFREFELAFAFPETRLDVDATRFICLWSRYKHLDTWVLDGAYDDENVIRSKEEKRLCTIAGQKIKCWNLMKKNGMNKEARYMKKLNQNQTMNLLFATLTLIQLDLAGASLAVDIILKYLNWEEISKVMILSNDHFTHYLTGCFEKSLTKKVFLQNTRMHSNVPINFYLSRTNFCNQYKEKNFYAGCLVSDGFEICKKNLFHFAEASAGYGQLGENMLNQRVLMCSMENESSCPSILQISADYRPGMMGAFNCSRELVAIITRNNIVEIHQLVDPSLSHQAPDHSSSHSFKSLVYRFDGLPNARVINLSWAPEGNFLLIEIANHDNTMAYEPKGPGFSSSYYFYKTLFFFKVHSDNSMTRLNSSAAYVVNTQLSSHSLWLSSNQFLLVGNHNSNHLEVLTFALSGNEIMSKLLHTNVHEIVPGCRSELSKNYERNPDPHFNFCNIQYVAAYFGIPRQGVYHANTSFGVVMNCPFLHDHDRIAIFNVSSAFKLLRLRYYIDIPGNLMGFHVESDQILLTYTMDVTRNYDKNVFLQKMESAENSHPAHHQCSFLNERFSFLSNIQGQGCVLSSISLTHFTNGGIQLTSKTLYW